MWDILLLECRVVTGVPGSPPLEDAAIGIRHDKLSFVGPRESLPGRARDLARETRHLDGAWVTPGLIDCHTHLVFAGNRAMEWDLRAQGASYEEIARAGGGILSTVRETRAATEEQLVDSALRRARVMAREGVTTVEIKSGYGLDFVTEVKMLRAAGRVGEKARLRVRRTYLGAHALPPGCDRAVYVDEICNEIIPALVREGLADAVDAFCESIAYTPAEVERIFTSAKTHGFDVKLHAEQLSDCGGAALAARHKALSADHLEHLSEEGIAAMAQAGTVAVLLPAAFYFLHDTKLPPVEALREAGVPMAVATDCNPGTSPVVSLLTSMTMACTQFGLTPEEALAGTTRCAAAALGLQDEIGTLEAGKAADLAVWNIAAPTELAYWIGADLLEDRYLGGISDKYGHV